MQHRLNKVNSANDQHSLDAEVDGRPCIVDNTSEHISHLVQVPTEECVRSYHDVYQRVRLALGNPVYLIWMRIRRTTVYSLPVIWGFVGCLTGLAFAAVHQHVTPSVNLPTKQEMNAVFALHDLNELLIASHPQIRDKS
ncbi:MAG: hypothetical protein RLZZ78_1271 [Armatimonadota bacterium]|jgi:hypothetical protein